MNKPILIVSLGPSVVPLLPGLSQTFDLVSIGGVPVLPVQTIPIDQGGLDRSGTLWAASEGARCSANVIKALEANVIQTRLLNSIVGVPSTYIRPFVAKLPGLVNLKVQEYAALLLFLERWRRERVVAGVVLHNDVEGVLKLVAIWANRFDIPSIHIPHAVYTHFGRLATPGSDVHDDVTCKTVLAISPYQAEWYKARGAQDVEVVGAAMWEHWLRWNLNREFARRALRIAPETKVATYAATWGQHTSIMGLKYMDFPDLAYRAFMQACKLHNILAIVKIHPSAGPDSESWHKQVAKELDVPCILTRLNRELSVYASDAVVGCGPSGLLLEAALVGVPGLIIGNAEFGFAGCPPEAGAIGRALETLDDSWESKRESILETYVGPVDGALQRTLEAIYRRVRVSE